jgi:hypothetical protein
MSDQAITEKTVEGILNFVVKLKFSAAKHSTSRNFLYTTFYMDQLITHVQLRTFYKDVS